ncbi:hypothetical protein FB451DRAFT_1192527 [Mycena latifolia]|nr:hypothetical protein FB451DRAFT_1192527 [Mycena latifolia]
MKHAQNAIFTASSVHCLSPGPSRPRTESADGRNGGEGEVNTEVTNPVKQETPLPTPLHRRFRQDGVQGLQPGEDQVLGGAPRRQAFAQARLKRFRGSIFRRHAGRLEGAQNGKIPHAPPYPQAAHNRVGGGRSPARGCRGQASDPH